MQHLTFDIRVSGSLEETKLITYIQNYSDELYINKRGIVLILPGGAYSFTSEREGEVLAMKFLSMGYHAAILKYSCEPAQYPTQILEVAAAVALLRDNCEEWNIDPEKIIVQGSSAGGHLAASYGCFWHEDFIAEQIGVEQEEKELFRPNGLILSYPVITSGTFAHRGSIVNVAGSRYDELLDKLSLEHQVSEFTPPTFLWHTFADAGVPCENSMLFAMALRKENIPFELHVYPVGSHGLGLATEQSANAEGGLIEPHCQSWITLAETWLKSL
ncbi:MAG: alpha/beta hydrolase [Lachnospiraceae bacterium]